MYIKERIQITIKSIQNTVYTFYQNTHTIVKTTPHTLIHTHLHEHSWIKLAKFIDKWQALDYKHMNTSNVY